MSVDRSSALFADPRFFSLATATPHGTINIAWGHNSNGKINMEITAPKGTTGYITLPFSGSFSVNGKAGKMGEVEVKGGAGKMMIVQG